jgi:putative Mn2+ efflux pump MntP
MGIIEVVLIAIALAMDCFAVSVAGGIIVQKFQWKWVLRMAFLFGLFQGVMPLIGYTAGYFFKSYIENYDHWLALFILLFLGLKMIREGAANEEEENERAKSICPLRWSSLLLMALATSIDALATGIIFISFPTILLKALLIIGFASFIFSIAGSFIGTRFGGKFNFRIEILGGIILIIIGIKIFVEHMWFNG